jgi:hypothetical protein
MPFLASAGELMVLTSGVPPFFASGANLNSALSVPILLHVHL